MRWSSYVAIRAALSGPGTMRHPVGLFSYGRPQFPQFGGQVADAIGFLVADMPHTANPRRTLGKQCHCREGLDGIADLIHLCVDSLRAADRSR